jgi:MIP family channel proteins
MSARTPVSPLSGRRASGSTQASPQRTLPQASPLIAACVAEFIGTFGLVFAGCGAIMIDALSGGQITHVGVGLVFGLIIAALIYATGHLSGAHLNPAVTLGFVLARHLPVQRLASYWLAQIAGALAAGGVLRILFGDVAHVGATIPAGAAWQSFALEVLLTFFLMFVIMAVMAVATDTRAIGQAAALAIGATVGLEALFAGPISGASMNPARSLAPALVGWVWTAQWVYLTAPLLGAAGAALLARYPERATEISCAALTTGEMTAPTRPNNSRGVAPMTSGEMGTLTTLKRMPTKSVRTIPITSVVERAKSTKTTPSTSKLTTSNRAGFTLCRSSAPANAPTVAPTPKTPAW